MSVFKYTFFVLAALLFFNVSELYCQTRDLSGIKFFSKEVERSKRTSLLLNDNKPIELKYSFSISFDMAFWYNKYWGPILRITDEKDHEIKIFYNQHLLTDTSVIRVIEPVNKNVIKISVNKNDLYRNHWFNFKLIFDKSEKKLKAYWNNEFKGEVDYEFVNNNYYSFAFGIKDFSNYIDFDVPAITIKNIAISERNKIKYFWELNPVNKNPLSDRINGSKILAINPGWNYIDHQEWKKVAEFKVSEQTVPGYGVAYDSVNNRLFIDRKNDMLVYNLISGKDSVINYNSPGPAYWNDLFYDDENQLLYSFMTAMGKISIFNLRKGEWIVKDTLNNWVGHYFGSSKFIYPNGGYLYLLGGYGWYTAKKNLFKYNFNRKEWVEIKLEENQMTPRAFLTMGKGFKTGEYLVYGGIGNESGIQEDGFNSFNDLYVLNIDSSTLINTNRNIRNSIPYVRLANYLQLFSQDSVFYFLATVVEENKKLYFSLNKLDLKNDKITPVANKFREQVSDKWLYHNFYYNKFTEEFFTVIFDTTNVELYSINYPTISESEKKSIEENVRVQNANFSVLYLAGIISILGILLFYFYYKRKNKVARLNEYSNTEKKELTNALIVFGGFRIYDKKGKELSQFFSPRLKEIFLLILFRSFNGNHIGITSEELSSVIWPDASPENAKSNRGVAINKIRKILSDVEGISVEFSDKVWLIKIQNSFWFDYAEYLRLQRIIKNDGNDSGNLLIELMQICEEGEILKGISYEWLDSIKFALNNEIIAFLKSFFSNGSLMQDSDNVIRLCDAILSIDIVDQDAFKTKIQTLAKEGRHQMAKNTYNLFIAEYKRLYDEDYPISFQEILPQ